MAYEPRGDYGDRGGGGQDGAFMKVRGRRESICFHCLVVFTFLSFATGGACSSVLGSCILLSLILCFERSYCSRLLISLNSSFPALYLSVRLYSRIIYLLNLLGQVSYQNIYIPILSCPETAANSKKYLKADTKENRLIQWTNRIPNRSCDGL